MNYRDWYAQYLALYKRNLAPKTRESYDHASDAYLLPVVGDIALDAITPEHIQTAINAAADRGSRQAQIVYSVAHAVLRRAYRSRLIVFNPVDAIDKPDHEQEQGKALTDADYAATVREIVYDLPLSLALFAGLRRGEICGLQWGDVDLSAGVLHVRRQRCRARGELITKPPKSRAGTRDVPIAGELLPQLRSAYRLSPRAWVVDLTPEALSRRWRDLQRRELTLSDHYRLHDLRHTYGSRLVLDGVNLRVVQYLMGHSKIDVTMRVYSHCRADDARKEYVRVYG